MSFQTTEAASLVVDLPPELLSRIFSYLGSQRLDIAHCRLVCHSFHELSSPFLITRVAVAKRLKELTRLHEVLEHPYFSRHVRELVYDASRYDKDVAEDWNEYVDDCENGPRKFVDAEWNSRRKNDAEALSGLLLRSLAPTDSGRKDTDNGDGGAVNSEQGASRSRQVDLEEPNAAYLDGIYAMGCHKGFPDYHQLYYTQRRIEKQGLIKNTLIAAFRGFPKLRNIVFSDYRALGRDGESYNECCTRLFGTTLQPNEASHFGTNETLKSEHGTIFEALVASGNTTVTSICAGPHLFENVDEPDHDTGERFYPEGPVYMEWDIFDLDEPGLGTLLNVFSRMRRFRHSLFVPSDIPREITYLDSLNRCLHAATSTLTYLSLNAGGTYNQPKTAECDLIDTLLQGTTFTVLQELDLCAFQSSKSQLESLLGRHSATLRRLRLPRLLVPDYLAKEFGTWASKHLTLSGVEVWGDFNGAWLDPNPCRSERARRRSQRRLDNSTSREIEHTIMRGRYNCIERLTPVNGTRAKQGTHGKALRNAYYW